MPLFGAIIEVFCQTLKTISWFKTFSMRLQGSSEPMPDYFYHDSVNQVSREDCVKWQLQNSLLIRPRVLFNQLYKGISQENVGIYKKIPHWVYILLFYHFYE